MTEHTYRVTGMDCAECARSIETGVARLDGVDVCALNFTTETLRVSGTIASADVVARVRELGYDVAEPGDPPVTSDPTNFLTYLWQRPDTRLALAGAMLILPGLLFHELLPGLGVHHWIIDALSVAAMVLAGYPIARSAWRAVRVNHDININVLMTIAAVGAVFIGAYTEAGLVMVLFAIGEALEGYTAGRARSAIRTLMSVVPDRATVLRPCIDCAGHLGQDGYSGGPCPFCGLEEQRVPVAELQVGETIVVKPGERIPMDGRVLSGVSAVDQAAITGESRLVEKRPGDEVFASSINGSGALDIEVTHLATDNTISRVIRLVSEAQEKKAPAQRFVDRFARIYTPLVVLLALLVAAVPPLLFGEPFFNPAPGVQGWLYRALALLVVACPCALVISTPVAIVSAISNGARHGVLFKGGVHLEELGRVQALAFDKTGTLTQGRPAVVAVQSAACAAPDDARCAPCDDLLALASAVEARSEHPLAQAVVARAEDYGVRQQYPQANGVTALSGRGVTGEVNGRQITIGSHRYFDDHVAHDAFCTAVAEADARGYTTMLVSEDERYVGYLALADEIRDSSPTAVAELRALGLDPIMMLTGDNEATAQTIAAQAGIDDVRANCLPEDKLTAVETLRARYGRVAMVGDGINDAPALAAADVGIAIGHTAQAMETADVTLMGDDLRQLPFAIRLSRAAMRTIRLNVGLSLGIKVLVLLLVLAGLGSMWAAVVADVGVSLLVTLIGMRLLYTPVMKREA